METEERSGPGRAILFALGGLMLISGVLVAAELAVPLQPKLTVSAPPATVGVATILMPPSAAVNNFSPANITVVLGVNNTIEWVNQDTTAHTVYSSSVPAGATPFQSGILSNGDKYRVTLNVTGTYDYYCSIHPATMRGSVTVKGSSNIAIPPGTAVGQLNYSPAHFIVVIGVNNTVTFMNQDTVVHTVTSDDGTSFNSGDIAASGSWTFTFTHTGTYSFHCIYHSGFMKGTVTVVSGP